MFLSAIALYGSAMAHLRHNQAAGMQNWLQFGSRGGEYFSSARGKERFSASSSIYDIGQGSARIERHIELVSEEMNVAHPASAAAVAQHSVSRVPAIETRDLHKSFGAFKVLKGVSFAAHEHQVVTIIGASGSGKSTFLRCLNFLEQPDSGEIRFKGESLCIADPRHPPRKQIEALRRRTGMVFQQFNLWSHWTVLENLTKVPIQVHGVVRAEAKERALELLNRVGLSEKKDAYPAALSGGQQQRVAIARALAIEPELLLFDEPTSALDPGLVGEVLTVIRGLAQEGRTMIVVTHEMSFAREVSDRVVFFHDGCVEEDGPPSEVLKRPRSAKLASFLRSVR